MDSNLVKQIMGTESSSKFSQVTISLSSPEVISSWSRGEIKNPETINYRTFKPEKGGLFCERIFGPTRDWECNCGKYKRIKHKGIVCDRCGVEVTQSRVRRERMGHIDLAVAVSHIWFFKCMPSRLGLVLDMTAMNLEKIIYYEDWIITDPGDTPLEIKQILTDAEYKEALELYGSDSFSAAMGAPAVKELLSKVKPKEILEDLKIAMAKTKSLANHKKIAKRMRLMEGFIQNGTQPEWMIIEVLPVIPPDLRPLVPLEGGRFATSDLNDLYRRVINRNNRLKNLLHLRTPEVIIRNEKRMLQEAVDALLDNGRHGRAVTGTGNRQLKSLCDMLKGKQGRFRQNLLGKRVDYSGRSVIVVGPELKLNQCGIPKKMALILFEPFIIRRLKELGLVHTVRSAKKMIEKGSSEVWDVLEEVIQGHPVMLNRAPTLHRLSIQAFDPVLIEGKAIRIHPLVCAAYNADFDGDQMAVHIPLSNEAQLEVKLLMLSPNNIFSPANGKPLATPSQDMTLGAYFLTYWDKKNDESKEEDKYYNDLNEVLWALDSNVTTLHKSIKIINPDLGKDTPLGNSEDKYIRTTAGRCIFSTVWPPEMGFFNHVANKKMLSSLVTTAYKNVGLDKTVKTLDLLKTITFDYATKSGMSIAIDDMIIPEEKHEIIERASKEIDEVREQYQNGVITDGERYNKCIDIWTQANNLVASVLFSTLERNNGLDEINSVHAMLDSGARGSKDQIRQLAGMRGLMAKPSGDIIERPILSSFREGLSVLEYFISSHGARKGLADTALKTADSGYMTRKLVDVAQDVICTIEDCETSKSIRIKSISEGDEETIELKDRIVGRFCAEDISNPLSENNDDYIIRANEEVTLEIAEALEDVGVKAIQMRSALTCEAETGICVKCYGRMLSNDELTKIGDAVGIIAAQSIGEPGTQLTMRTFHFGGTFSSAFKQPVIKAKVDGIVEILDARTVELEDGNLIVLNKNATIKLINEKGTELEINELVTGSIISTKPGKKVKEGEIYVKWDPYNVPIITETKGTVEFRDLVEGATLKKEVNKTTGLEETIVLEHREDLHPQIAVLDTKGDIIANYSLPGGAHIMVTPKGKVKPGEILARIPRQSARTKDITGGLPRVAELFEARQPKEAAIIARIDGIVSLGKISRGKRLVTIKDPENDMVEEHLVPTSKRIIIYENDYVKKGAVLTDGNVVLQDILEVCGPQELQDYLVNEVQEVYRLQGVEINDKHIEIIVKQMLKKVRVTNGGTTKYLPGEQIDKKAFLAENNRVLAEGGQPAEAETVLLGITKASLETDSFISAASFQDTTRILTEAASLGKVDNLKGFKENVIMGHLIPAGTGIKSLTSIKLSKSGSSIAKENSDKNRRNSGTENNDKLASAKAMLSLDS